MADFASTSPATELEEELLRRRLQRRSWTYAAVFVALCAAALVVGRSDWASSPELHTEMEIIATLVATAVGTLSLVRFYTQRNSAYLYIGAGFITTAVLDAQHALLTSTWLAGRLPSNYPDLVAWSWSISRMFLAVTILLAWHGWRRQREFGSSERVRPRRLYAAMAALLVVSSAFIALVPVPAAHFPSSPIQRPFEFVPALLLIGGFIVHHRKQWQKANVFDFWLMLSLVMGIALETAFMPFSAAPSDAFFDAAHLLKIVSYVLVLIGLMISVFSAYRRLESTILEHRKLNLILTHEIDTRREAQRTLADSQARLQDILDNATDLIQSVAPDGTFEYVNRAWLDTLGYTAAEVDGLTIRDIIAEDSLPHCMQVFQEVMTGRSVENIEAIFVTESGARLEVSGSANPRIKDGAAVSTRSIFRNVTEPRRAERERERFFNMSQDILCIAGIDGFLKRVNPAFERILGYSEEELLSRPFLDFVYHADRQSTQLELAGLAEGRPTHHFENRYLAKSGEIRRLAWSASPAEDGLVYAVARDITDLAATRAELVSAMEAADAANRAKSEFLANMSHELRTPLNSVLGLTSVMLLQDELAEEPRHLLERVQANGKHLLELINDVLDLSKIEVGKVELELREVDPIGLLREVVAQVEPLAAAKSLELRIDVPERAAPLRSDSARLGQVLVNLVGNAIKFTDSGHVSLRLEVDEPSGTALEILVEDTGIGIHPDRLDVIFDPFTQADGSMNRRFGGTGLGLSISRSLCSMMGFGLRVRSSVGEGSTFIIDLHAANVRAGADEGSRRPHAAAEGGDPPSTATT